MVLNYCLCRPLSLTPGPVYTSIIHLQYIPLFSLFITIIRASLMQLNDKLDAFTDLLNGAFASITSS